MEDLNAEIGADEAEDDQGMFGHLDKNDDLTSS